MQMGEGVVGRGCDVLCGGGRDVHVITHQGWRIGQCHKYFWSYPYLWRVVMIPGKYISKL